VRHAIGLVEQHMGWTLYAYHHHDVWSVRSDVRARSRRWPNRTADPNLLMGHPQSL
jgi:hypothetical protein